MSVWRTNKIYLVFGFPPNFLVRIMGVIYKFGALLKDSLGPVPLQVDISTFVTTVV